VYVLPPGANSQPAPVLFNAFKGGGMKFRSIRSDRRRPSVIG